MDFYVCIPTIRKYNIALEVLLSSLPAQWKNKYIVIYQNEEVEEKTYKTFEDGHIEVYIKNNIYEYGTWIGVNLLLEMKIVPDNCWFLFIHDTCKFLGEESATLTHKIIEEHKDSDIDILWLSSNGQCNICLIRKKAIEYGNNIYKDLIVLSKMEAIRAEWSNHSLSPKFFPVNQKFIPVPANHVGRRLVYNNTNNRDVLIFTPINMEKYYFFTLKDSDHPQAP